MHYMLSMTNVYASIAWKYLHPYPSEHLGDLKLSHEQIHAEGIEYGCALRYNLTSRELSVLVDSSRRTFDSMSTTASKSWFSAT